MKIFRPDELAEKLGVSTRTLLNWRKRGDLPPPRQLGGNVVGWPEKEIREWLESRPPAETGRGDGRE